MSGTDCATSVTPAASAAAASVTVPRRRSGLDLAMALSPTRRPRLRTQQDFLHSPRCDLGHVDLVGIPAVHLVNAAELLECVAGLAEPAQHRAVQLHLVHFACRRR